MSKPWDNWTENDFIFQFGGDGCPPNYHASLQRWCELNGRPYPFRFERAVLETPSYGKYDRESYDDILDWPLELLNLTPRVFNNLRFQYRRIRTVRQLVAMSSQEIVKRDGFGRKMLQQLDDALEEHGLSLREEEELLLQEPIGDFFATG